MATSRVAAAIARARAAMRARPRPPRTRALTVLVCLVIGLMLTVSSLNARGTDLRPGRNTDLSGLVGDMSRRNAELTRQVAQLRSEVDALSAGPSDLGLRAELDRANREGAMVALSGPAVTVTLTDAPASVEAPGVDQDLLVVHQQDIQAVVNALWANGAEAMTIQGQRVVSTTGIKCVGSTVVLHGTPYAPPYVITAIGDPRRLNAGLDESDYIRVYKQYVGAYHLGYEQATVAETTLPPYAGTVQLEYARPLR